MPDSVLPSSTQRISELEQALARQKAYMTLAAQANRATDIHELYGVISTFLPSVLGVPRASLAILGEAENQGLFQVIALGGMGDVLSIGQWVPLEHTAIEAACSTLAPVSTLEHPLEAFVDWQLLHQEKGFTRFIICPLRSSQGSSVGTLNMAFPPNRSMSIDDVHRAEAFAQVVASSLELRLLNRRLKESLAALEDAQQRLVQRETVSALGNLMAGFAHELNTPLGVAMTATSYSREEILAVQAILSSKAVSRRALERHLRNALDSLDMASDSVSRGTELVRELRAATAKDVDRQIEEIALGSFCRKIVDGLSPVLSKHGAAVRIQGSGGVITTDTAALKGLLTNLIQNACIHGYGEPVPGSTDARWIDVTMDVNDQVSPPEVAITVRDYGKGIPPENRKKIFEPFFTTRRGKGGSGLGLHLVHSHAFGSLQGSLELLDVSPGTAFHCLFPGLSPSFAEPQP